MDAFAQEIGMDPAEVRRKNLAARIPQFATIDEVSKTPMTGIFEVRINGSDLYYTDAQGDYLMQGNLIDVRERKNLTEARVEKLTEIAFDKLPLQDAFKIVRGNGKRKLAIFEDPNCGYCKRLKSQLDRAGVAYDEVNIEEVPDGAELVQKANGGNETVPTVWFADGSTLTNPSARQVQDKLS